MKHGRALSAVPVFFRPEMMAAERPFAPGTFKPGACVDDWRARHLRIDVRAPEPVTVEQLCLAHDHAYVDGILRGEIRNGFGDKGLDVAASLPYTVGAMVAATQEALRNGAVACAPVSGFHHAHHAASAGYCTFNGLVVAAAVLQQHQPSLRVGILDLDQHYGDGTQAIIDRRNLHFIDHQSWGVETRDTDQAEDYLRTLNARVARFAPCDVLLYQAGADPHVDDPLGGWMTTEQLNRRDQIVFRTCRAMGLPVAWNLAGGYQRDAQGGIGPVLEVHRNTMRSGIETFAI